MEPHRRSTAGKTGLSYLQISLKEQDGRLLAEPLPQVKMVQSGLMVRSDETGSGFAQSDARSRYLEGGRVHFSDSSRKHLAIEAVHNLQ